MKHALVPEMKVLSAEQAKKVLSSLGVKTAQLPLISIDDAGLKGLEVKPGDVIDSIRFSPVTQKDEHYYRLVVEELS
jgi:DNA-directed RNA polymerase subunit H (RpoH/RPB5)